MFKQPASLTTHITIFGNTNVGKSSFFNALLGQDRAIVSPQAGTTTDPVQKRFELIPYGPIILTDTAGLDDTSTLGAKRVGKTTDVIAKTDFAIVLIDAIELVAERSEITHSIEADLEASKTPYLKIVNKADLLTTKQKDVLEKQYPTVLFISSERSEDIQSVQKTLVEQLGEYREKSLIANLFEPGSTIALVVPVDSEAPKGRLILPQVQVIRDCLDHNVNALVTNEINLAKVLEKGDVDLVITDSQAFHTVKELVGNTPLTSFSIVLARYKGDLKYFVRGAEKLSSLTEKSRVLVCESCSHNVGHEDIGEIKIPKLLKKRFGEGLTITHVKGHDFPPASELTNYDLIIHCGGCMLNQKAMEHRLRLCADNQVSITNYGIYLAYESGILDRAVEIFHHEL